MYKYYEEVDKKIEKQVQGVGESYQSKVLAHDILIRKLGEKVDKLKETVCDCVRKRRCSLQEYGTPSFNDE